jgi:hypothetical protein
MRSSILATIPGFRQRIIPEPSFPSQGSQARGTRLSEHIAIPSKQRRLSRPNTIEEIRQKRRKRNKQQREKNKKMSKTEKRYKIGHKMQHKLLEQGNTIQKLTVRVQKERKRAVDFWRLWDKEKMLRSMSNM